VTGHVHFAGYQKDPLPFMQAADVAAFPSIFEVLSLAMLEVMALGKPVVASDHASFLEAITPGREGLIVPRRRSAPLAEALIRVLHHPDFATELGAAASCRVRSQFTIDRLAADMADLYRSATRSSESMRS
jgi:glycosyltransferase involved in cell wall biosynthesis